MYVRTFTYPILKIEILSSNMRPILTNWLTLIRVFNIIRIFSSFHNLKYKIRKFCLRTRSLTFIKFLRSLVKSNIYERGIILSSI